MNTPEDVQYLAKEYTITCNPTTVDQGWVYTRSVTGWISYEPLSEFSRIVQLMLYDRSGVFLSVIFHAQLGLSVVAVIPDGSLCGVGVPEPVPFDFHLKGSKCSSEIDVLRKITETLFGEK